MATSAAASAIAVMPRIGLVQLCASHVNSERRAERLRAMLASWAQQTQPAPMYLSISFSSDSLKQLALKVIKERAHCTAELIVLCNKTSKSQFQHYRQLATRLTQEQEGLQGEVWCMFTDDDDESHPERTASYAYVLGREAQAGTLSTASCVFEEEQADTHAQYAKAFAQAVAKKGQDAGDAPKFGRDREYFHYAVRVCTLVDFCTRVDPTILAHPFADTMFSRYLQCPEKRARLVSFTPKQALLVQYEGDEHYLRGRTDPFVPLLKAAKQTLDHAPAAELDQAAYALARLELLRWVRSFASAYYPSASEIASPDGPCPSWVHFRDDSRMIVAMKRVLKGQPPEAEKNLLFADKEAVWQALYEDLIRHDSGFRAWIDSPRFRPGTSSSK
jgi:hypothetical protein